MMERKHKYINGVTLLVLVFSAGCPGVMPGGVVPDPPNGTDVVDGNRDSSATSAVGKTSGEPNGSFDEAIVAVFDEAGVAQLQGVVSQRSDLDVFWLGALVPGDRLVIDTITSSSDLDISVALFDGDGRLAYANDDRNVALTGDRDLDSFIDWVVRHESDSYYLVATNSTFASGQRGSGSYSIDIELAQGNPVPSPAPQILLLQFDGGTVNSQGLGNATIVPFDASAISSAYAGQTDTLKELIRQSMEQNFARFNVEVRTSDDPPLADGVKASTMFFGGFDAQTFGIANGVDSYNQDFCDDGIMFTETFRPDIFSRTPTAEELAIAIGNVASHEAGHLLGLNHVDDDLALMDDRSAADAFIEDQEFIESPLSSDIMSIGTQDAALLLTEIVGLAGT